MEKPASRLFFLFTVAVIALQGVMWGWSIRDGGTLYSGAWVILIALTMAVLYNWAMLRFSINSSRIQELEESINIKQFIINESFDYMFVTGLLDQNKMSPEIIDIVRHRLHEKREEYDARVKQPKLPFEKEGCCSCCR